MKNVKNNGFTLVALVLPKHLKDYGTVQIVDPKLKLKLKRNENIDIHNI